MLDGTDAVSDWPHPELRDQHRQRVPAGSAFHHGGGVGIGFSQHAGQVIVADGTPEAEARLKRVLTNDPMMGIFRHADAGYDIAKDCARDQNVQIPMKDW